MNRIELEKKKIQKILTSIEEKDPIYQQLYAAQQAISWFEDPNGAKSPYNMIMHIPSKKVDCPRWQHLLQYADTCDHCE